MGLECGVARGSGGEARQGGMKLRRREVIFLCAQPDAITDSGSHVNPDSSPYAIAHSEPDAIADSGADSRPDAWPHTEVR